MTDAGQVKAGDFIRLRGHDGQIVEVGRYASAGLNWSVWEVALRGQPEHRWLLRLHGQVYEVTLTRGQPDSEAVQVAADRYQLARQGGGQREIATASGREFGPCEFAYYVGDDGSIAIRITDRGWVQLLTGTPVEHALVELFPA